MNTFKFFEGPGSISECRPSNCVGNGSQIYPQMTWTALWISHAFARESERRRGLPGLLKFSAGTWSTVLDGRGAG
jgi:hypothetical protein